MHKSIRRNLSVALSTHALLWLKKQRIILPFHWLSAVAAVGAT